MSTEPPLLPPPGETDPEPAPRGDAQDEGRRLPRLPFSALPLSPIRPGRRCHGRPARYGRLLLTCTPHRAGPHGRRGSRRSWKRLLELLPEELTRRVEGHPELPALVEVVMDLGRPPLARFPSGDFLLSHRPISFDDLLHATSQVQLTLLLLISDTMIRCCCCLPYDRDEPNLAHLLRVICLW